MIVAAQKRTLGGRELQLPCMSSLTSKTSTQKFFLRVLQVIIQLREDTRRANKKAKQTGRLGRERAHTHTHSETSHTCTHTLCPPVWLLRAAIEQCFVYTHVSMVPDNPAVVGRSCSFLE